MSPPQTPQPMRVLVVDHDQKVALAASAALGEAGHGVIVASTEAEALAAVSAAPPDLVLLDPDLPGTDVSGLCRRFKSDPALDGALVVLTTASPDAWKDLADEADGCIPRTIRGPELSLLVQTFARLARLTRNLREQAVSAEIRVEELARIERDAEARARDLSEANTALVDSRRAALNLIDDAIDARHAIEAANAELLAEVAERRRVEDTLRKISAATEQSPVSVIVTNLEGNVEYVNPHFTRVSGYSLEETLGRNPRFLQSGETPPETYAKLWETIASGGVWEGEFRNRRKNGELFWEHAIICAVRDLSGVVTSYVGVKEDITERKKTEQALRESEEKHRLLADNARDVIWTMTGEGRFTYVSPSIERLTGFTTAEAMDRTLEETVAPGSLSEVRATFGTAIQAFRDGTQEPEYRLEVEQKCKDGSTVWVEVTASFMFDAEDRFLGVLGVSRDVTERRKAQGRVAAQLAELLRWQSVMLGREGRVQELKKEVNELSRRLGGPLPYPSEDTAGSPKPSA